MFFSPKNEEERERKEEREIEVLFLCFVAFAIEIGVLFLTFLLLY